MDKESIRIDQHSRFSQTGPESACPRYTMVVPRTDRGIPPH